MLGLLLLVNNKENKDEKLIFQFAQKQMMMMLMIFPNLKKKKGESMNSDNCKNSNTRKVDSDRESRPVADEYDKIDFFGDFQTTSEIGLVTFLSEILLKLCHKLRSIRQENPCGNDTCSFDGGFVAIIDKNLGIHL